MFVLGVHTTISLSTDIAFVITELGSLHWRRKSACHTCKQDADVISGSCKAILCC